MVSAWHDRDRSFGPGPLEERPPLEAARLRRQLLVPGSLFTSLQVVDQTGSTNADVREFALTGAPEGTVLAAEQQVRGRGRLDRPWVSPPRAGLTFSVLLRPVGVPARRWTWLPLLTGCAVVDAINGPGSVGARLKWPNDVLVNAGPERSGKVCGILLERVETPAGPAAVLGIGLNVLHRRDELPTPTAGSLSLAMGRPVDRERLLVAVLSHLAEWYDRWREAAGDPEQGLRASYRERCATVGTVVRVQTGSDSWVEGTALDVDGDGRLVVETADGREAFSAGDVVHVRPGGLSNRA